MIILIKTELLKLKRSYMLLLCLAGSICSPLLNWLISLNNERWSGVKTDFYDFMSQSNMFTAILIGTLLYSLFTTYIFEREFTDNMYKHLFTVPVSKFNLLISKLIVIMLGLLALTLTSYIFGIILSLISGFPNMNLSNILDTIVLYLKGYAAFIPLMIPVILVTLIFKGFVAPIAFSIIAEIILFIVMQSKYIALYPWSAPILFGTDMIDPSIETEIIGNLNYNLISIIVLGIIAFIGCLIYLNRKEVA